MGIGKSKQTASVVCVGLNDAGKSTIINYLKPKNQQVDDLQPTVGLSTEKFKYGSVSFTVHDMSGAKQYRNLWKENLDGANGVIFVVDSADQLRLRVAENELMEIIDLAAKDVPFLFLANKMDLPRAMSKQQIAEELNIAKHCADRRWNIVSTNALKGIGLDEGMNWLSSALPNIKK